MPDLNHYTAVGIPIDTIRDPDSYAKVYSHALQHTTRVHELGDGLVLAGWDDPSGASLELLLRDGKVACSTPQFRGLSTQRIRPRRTLSEHDGCPSCAVTVVDLFDSARQMAVPVGVAPLSAAVHRRRLRDAEVENPYQGSLVYVVEEAFGVWANVDAFVESAGGRPNYSPTDMQPVGLYAASVFRTAAVARFSGIVLEVEERSVEAFGTSFLHLRMSGFGGIFDVVSAKEDLPDVAVGNVVAAIMWVAGRLADPVTLDSEGPPSACAAAASTSAQPVQPPKSADDSTEV